MDENVHRAITSGLRLRGIDALTVQEDGLSGIDDPAVFDRAASLGRVLFSQDEDLLAEAKKRQTEGRSFPGVIFAHPIHVTIGDCPRDLELIAVAANPAALSDRVEFLPL